MSMKRSGGRKLDGGVPPSIGEVMAEICAPSKVEAPSVGSKPLRARRAGPFKIPTSIAGAPSSERSVLARRFKQHLRGVSGANKLGPDPDEAVPVVKPGRERPGRSGFPRPGFGNRPNPMSRFGRPSPSMRDDDEDD